MKKVITQLGCVGVSLLLMAPQVKAQDAGDTDFTSYLTNPSFELYFDAEANDGEGEWKTLDIATSSIPGMNSNAYRDTPHGWTAVNADLLSLMSVGGTARSYGVNVDASNKEGNNVFWVNSRPLPEYELSQEVENLPAGKYYIRCRMAVQGASPTKITTQRLFAETETNSAAQYFGNELNYGDNLGDEEVITYANHVADATDPFWLKEMELVIEVKDGEKLTLGVRTNNVKADKTLGTDTEGWFKADDFRIEKYIDSNDATLKSININGTMLEGFDPEVESYTTQFVGLEPIIVAVTNNDKAATPVITYPSEYPGEVTIVVTAEDGKTTKTYKLNLSQDRTGTDNPTIAINAYVENGVLVIEGAEGAAIGVYTIAGQLVAQTSETTIALPSKGAYLVKIAGTTIKVLNK